jgi:hypothetical protein
MSLSNNVFTRYPGTIALALGLFVLGAVMWVSLL